MNFKKMFRRKAFIGSARFSTDLRVDEEQLREAEYNLDYLIDDYREFEVDYHPGEDDSYNIWTNRGSE